MCHAVIEEPGKKPSEKLDDDELYEAAKGFVTDQKRCSIKMLRNEFKIGYERGKRMVGKLLQNGVIMATEDGKGWAIKTRNIFTVWTTDDCRICHQYIDALLQHGTVNECNAEDLLIGGTPLFRTPIGLATMSQFVMQNRKLPGS